MVHERAKAPEPCILQNTLSDKPLALGVDKRHLFPVHNAGGKINLPVKNPGPIDEQPLEPDCWRVHEQCNSVILGGLAGVFI
jgi:hypothetical protein